MEVPLVRVAWGVCLLGFFVCLLMLLSLLFWEERRRQTLTTETAITSVRLTTV